MSDFWESLAVARAQQLAIDEKRVLIDAEERAAAGDYVGAAEEMDKLEYLQMKRMMGHQNYVNYQYAKNPPRPPEPSREEKAAAPIKSWDDTWEIISRDATPAQREATQAFRGAWPRQ
jgi:hypothetical protein